MPARYAYSMRTEVEAQQPRTPVLKRAFAGVVLIAAAALALKIVIGMVMAVFWTVVRARGRDRRHLGAEDNPLEGPSRWRGWA